MKILDIPQSGHLGTFISFKTRHGHSRRRYVVPQDPRTPAQVFMRLRFAQAAARWRMLTDAQRAAWKDAAAGVRSHGRLGDSGVLSGFQLFMRINANLALVGEPWMDNPPSRPQFSDSPVGDLAITNTSGAIALKLAVVAPQNHSTLVWATAPASPGTTFPGRFVFLGLLPAPVADAWDITEVYVKRYGAPAVNTRVFVRTVQQLDGWHDLRAQTTAVVPPP